MSSRHPYHESSGIALLRNKKRKARTSSTPPPKRKRPEAPSITDIPARIDCLTKLEEAFQGVFLKYRHVRTKNSKGSSEGEIENIDRPKDELTAEELGALVKEEKQFVADLEQAVFDVYCEPDMNGDPHAGPEYQDRFRVLQFNLSKPDRVALHQRIVGGLLQPREIAIMSSTDLASEEAKQFIKQTEQGASAHSMLVPATMPRTKNTHKSSEDIGVVHGSGSVQELGPESTLDSKKQSQARKRQIPGTGQEPVPMVEEVDNQQSFKLFEKGWILPPDSRRHNPEPGPQIPEQEPPVPMVEEVDNQQSFKLFEKGWILPPDSRRHNPEPGPQIPEQEPPVPMVEEVDNQQSFKLFEKGWILPPDSRRHNPEPGPQIPEQEPPVPEHPGEASLSQVESTNPEESVAPAVETISEAIIEEPEAVPRTLIGPGIPPVVLQDEQFRLERELGRLRAQRARTELISLPPGSPVVPQTPSWGGPSLLPLYPTIPINKPKSSVAEGSDELLIEVDISKLESLVRENLEQTPYAPLSPIIKSPTLPFYSNSLSPQPQQFYKIPPHSRPVDRKGAPSSISVDYMSIDPHRNFVDILLKRDAMIKWLQTLFRDKDRYRTLLALKGRPAQTVVDLLQELLDSSDAQESAFRKEVIVALQKLANNAEVYPSSYQIGEEIVPDHKCFVAGGGFGEIFKCQHRGQAVCVKMIRLTAISQREPFMRQFVKEAIIWAQLSHPNIVPFQGFFYYSNKPCLLSPWLNNGHINDYLRNNPSSNRYLLVKDMTEGLQYLHSWGIVHGDLKGVNVMVDDSGRARLTDFGISSIFDSALPHWSSLSTVASKGGSTRWQAPELFESNNDQEVHNTIMSDAYAWGCTCYEASLPLWYCIFVGKLPFYEIPKDFTVMFQVHRDGLRPSRPSDDDPAWLLWGLQDQFWDLMERCWANDPGERPTVVDLLTISQSMEAQDNRPIHLCPESPNQHRVIKGASEWTNFLTIDALERILSS